MKNFNVYIKGHPTRYEEVIKLLEEHGGFNCCNCTGDSYLHYYYIDNFGQIKTINTCELNAWMKEHYTELSLPPKCPESWEEYCNNFPIDGFYISSGSNIDYHTGQRGNLFTNRNLLPTKEEAEAFLALMQLRSLRKAWVEDWESDWGTTYNKWCIYYINNYMKVCPAQMSSHCLSFPTLDMATKFSICFKDLIEKAKILL